MFYWSLHNPKGVKALFPNWEAGIDDDYDDDDDEDDGDDNDITSMGMSLKGNCFFVHYTCCCKLVSGIAFD